MSDSYDLIAVCAFGLEALVRRELEGLGIEASVSQPGRVAFRGALESIARTNLWLRTADRIQIAVATFHAPDFDALFESTRQIDWGKLIPVHGEFPVTGRSIRSQLSSVPACQRSIKRAVVDALKRDHGTEQLAETGPQYRIDFTIVKDEVTLTLDTTGIGLNRRGYHAGGSFAPLKETLAAALVMLSYWRPGRPLIDPFCGAGTIAIEAAMQGRNLAPGRHRRFASEDWPSFPHTLWQELREQAEAGITSPLEPRIIATDSDPRAIRKAKESAVSAGVADDIHFEVKAMEATTSQRRFGCLITHPPDRNGMHADRELEAIYGKLPDVFRKLPTWSHYVLTSFPRFESLVGRKADRRRKLYNGRVASTYYQFHGPKPVTNPITSVVPAETTTAEAGEPQPGEPQPGEPLHGEPLHGETLHGETLHGETLHGEPQPGEPLLGGDTDNHPDLVDATAETSVPEKRYEHAVGPAAFGQLSAKAREQAELFAVRLKKRAKHLRRWPTKRGITCYRIYERDIPEIPLVVDIYEDCLHVTEYDRPHERDPAEHANWLDLMAETAGNALGIRHADVYLKRRGRQKGKNQHTKVAETHQRKVVHEGGLRFLVNLADYVDTGLFLDHRITRQMVREAAAGKTFLNLFCYTGSFSVYAAAGGARRTVSVDLSRNYLEWAKQNMSMNGFTGDQHTFVASDALRFIETHPQQETYDLVVVDPPTFSNSKRTEEDWAVQDRAEELLVRLLPLVHRGGVVFFSTNFRRFKFDPAKLPATQVHEISNQTIPEDFRNRRIHRCWRIVR